MCLLRKRNKKLPLSLNRRFEKVKRCLETVHDLSVCQFLDSFTALFSPGIRPEECLRVLEFLSQSGAMTRRKIGHQVDRFCIRYRE